MNLPRVYEGQYASKIIVSNYYPYGAPWGSATKCIYLGKTSGQDTALFSVRDDDLLVFNDDGTVNSTDTIVAFKAHFAAINLQIAFKPSEVQSTEPITCPSTYTVWNKGSETIIGGDTATVTQEYYVKVGG